jgi:DNA-binding response OmpR family regulator
VRILLVEDEPRLADSVARGLRQTAHAVDVVHSVNAAERQLHVGPYDAIVLDVLLPDGSGLDLAADLRHRGVSVPILMLTARDTVEDKVRGLDAGADDYLVKPFALEELQARLRALQRRRPETRLPTIQIGDLVLDPSRREATRGDRRIELTTTEYALLEYLARRPGVVCGRSQISAALWDEHSDPDSNIIDVYLSRLRRKIDRPGQAPMLHTIRGAGYTLDPDRKSLGT